MRKTTYLPIGLAALGVVAAVSWWRARPSRPEPGLAPRASAARDSVAPPRLLTSPGASVDQESGSPPSEVPAPVYSGFQVKWPDPPPAAGEAPRPAGAETALGAIGRYSQEICACQDLACAERVGLSHVAPVAASRYRPEDEPAIDRVRKRVTECLEAIAERPPAAPAGG